jgi:hypothetical protein
MNPDQEARLKALEDWKRSREAQQIVFPLDPKSIEILQNYFMRIVGDLQSYGVGGDIDTSYIGRQADKEFIVGKNQYIPYIQRQTESFLLCKSVLKMAKSYIL